jgi:hypothetical protein
MRPFLLRQKEALQKFCWLLCSIITLVRCVVILMNIEILITISTML